MVQSFSANALSEMQDADAVPLLIEAGQRSAEAATLLADSLAYFNDPRAIQFVNEHLPEAVIKEIRARRARGCLPDDCWLVGTDEHTPPRGKPIHNATFP